MSRYIDAEWLMNFFVDIPDNFTLTIGNLRATVNDAPSIDIVRCKECKWYKQSEAFCENGNGLWQAGDECFCNYGEREGE